MNGNPAVFVSGKVQLQEVRDWPMLSIDVDKREKIVLALLCCVNNQI